MLVSVSHVLACIFYFIGVNINDSWMVRDTEYGSGLNEAVWDQYLLSFFFVLATLSTNGVVGDLVPATFVEVVFAGALMIINMTLFAYILGQISSLVMKADDEVWRRPSCGAGPMSCLTIGNQAPYYQDGDG